jgi:hypothetical protein
MPTFIVDLYRRRLVLCDIALLGNPEDCQEICKVLLTTTTTTKMTFVTGRGEKKIVFISVFFQGVLRTATDSCWEVSSEAQRCRNTHTNTRPNRQEEAKEKWNFMTQTFSPLSLRCCLFYFS